MDLFDAAPPRLSPEGAERLAREVFGVSGTVESLPSERDRNFLIRAASGDAVLKLSHPAEDQAVVEMENAAMLHVARVDAGLPIPRVVPTLAGEPIGVTTGDDGRSHLTRLISVVPGQPVEGRQVSPALAADLGAATARLSIALRGFFHPAAGRTHVWDVRRVADLAPHLDGIPDPAARLVVERSLAACASAVAAVDRLPAQIEHADVTLTNVLTVGDELTGLIDFGDMHHTATVCDLAAGLTSVLRSVAGVGADEVVAVASAYLEGYQRFRPLLVDEGAVIGGLVQARLVATVLISAWRAALHPDNTAYISQYDVSSWALLRLLLDELDPVVVFARLVGTGRILGAQQPDPGLRARRSAAYGGGLSPVFYDEPLQIARGEGAYLYAADGRRYLDAYNNVPVVGHEHPAVVRAVSAQLQVLNTNSRYLHGAAVELAERLLATFPAELGLDTCVFVNSGTEAVDLTWRMATAATSRDGALVVEHGYHGISSAVVDFSTNEWPPGHDPAHVATFTAPHQLPDGKRPGAAEARHRVEAAAGRLRERGHHPALLLVDPMFTSEGILEPGGGFLAELGAAARGDGALVLADEVQSGFGRCGPDLWASVQQGLRPDFVTLGKPMGNGYPVAAVLTRRDIADVMGREYFSTFAGGPVAAMAALTVLDVLQDNRIPQSAVRVGDYLRSELRAVAAEVEVLGAVRGIGLIAGVDVTAPAGLDPRAFTRGLVESLREAGVLVGQTGRGGAVLKIRPPLIWQERHVDELVRALRAVLRLGVPASRVE